jgi:tetratricopeptide (TPR) repeat protein
LRKTAFWTFFLLVAICAFVQAGPTDDFATGNQFFQNKEYDKAIAAYNRVLGQGVESAPLHFNLGNAYFKSGDLGHAVLYYLKARRLKPADEDIMSNLAFARSLATVQLEGVQLNPISTLLESIVAPYRLNSLAWISSLLFVLFVLLLASRFGLGYIRVGLKAITVLVFILLICAASMTSFKYHLDYVTRWAVIVGDSAEVRSGPTDSAGLEFQGEPGLVVRINGESGDYFSVIFENQRQGWVKKSLLAEV